MATITVNDQPYEVDAGGPLVETLKALGIYVSNLCYIDGLPPYAGCRTCAVEIEGARGLPLSCTTPVQDGMTVRTDTPAVLEMRQQVMSVILANHSDRCLTCHRVEHCRTGDICLRDNVVSHRCVTCSKNYRCELQTASDLADIGRANVEPYLDEARTFYQSAQPPPDRNNPFLEFDPQMCIICTRCVRACDDLRHTTAVTLAGRGFSTRIAFGSGGTIDESNCDFCGACIDVCPTATLMESPNKWVARPDQWTHTVCTECALGCTIQMGVKNGRGVLVRPGAGNDVSRDQICVRGRFGYDQIRDTQRLRTGRLGRGDDALDTPSDEVLADAARRLSAILERHGPRAVGVLGSGQATNEDNYLARRLADLIGTPNLDASAGYLWAPVEQALREAFGSERLPGRLTEVERAGAIVVIADDLSGSNNVLGVRVKDAVINHGARLVSVSRRANAIDDHAHVVLRPPRGDSAEAVQAIVGALLADETVRAALDGVPGLDTLLSVDAPAEAVQASAAQEAAQTLLAARREKVAVILAPSRHSAVAAAAQTRAAANLAIALAGPEAAAASLYILPPEANLNGLRDMGVAPRPAVTSEDDDGNVRVEAEAGLDVLGMLEAARAGRLKALIVAKDNPLLLLPDTAAVRAALEALELLLVIDDVPTDTVKLASHTLPDVSVFAKEGTLTNADRQVLRLRKAFATASDARPAWAHLADLAARLAAERGLGAPPSYDSAAAVMDAIADEQPAYAGARHSRLLRQMRLEPNGAATPALLPPAPPAANGGGLVLLTGRDLYTDRESAAIHHPDADRLHRGEWLEIHPRDAASHGIVDGRPVTVSANGASLSITARVTEDVPPGAVFVPLLWDGGAVQALIGANEPSPAVQVQA